MWMIETKTAIQSSRIPFPSALHGMLSWYFDNILVFVSSIQFWELATTIVMNVAVIKRTCIYLTWLSDEENVTMHQRKMFILFAGTITQFNMYLQIAIGNVYVYIAFNIIVHHYITANDKTHTSDVLWYWVGDMEHKL